MGDQVRVKSKTIQQGLKPKLRNDRYGDAYEVVRVVSPQNVEIKYKNTTKIVNIDNVKLKEPMRIVGWVPQANKATNPALCGTKRHKDDRGQENRTLGEERATFTSASIPNKHYITRYGRIIRSTKRS